MSHNRNKQVDKDRTRHLILDKNRPKYRGGENWLGHGVGRSEGHAYVDELLLDGATMEQLEEERGGISSHLSHLKREHDLIVRRDKNGVYKFDRQHLGIPDTSHTIHQKDNSVAVTTTSFVPQAQDLTPPPADRISTTVSRIVRDTQLSNWVKDQHECRCQVCGETIQLADGSGYAEGHHLQPLGAPHNGPDVLENILCLCPNHHAACDFGAIPLALDDLRPANGHAVGKQYIDYHNQKIYRGSNPPG